DCSNTMQSLSTARAAARGALFTTPISISRLESENRACPICHEQYIEPPVTEHGHQTSDREWAVSVDMVAEWFGRKRCCGHIIGHRCLQAHLQASGPWRNKCPLCRNVWFHHSNEDDNLVDEPGQTGETRIDPISSSLRRSRRIADQTAVRRETPVTPTRDRAGTNQHSYHTSIRKRSRRTAQFTQQLLETLEVAVGSVEVRGTLEEVERKLEALYCSM
ncbi:hypothetical protein P153DRAFT_284987, partial [Dothidotthia symphoricarpi CBS 119687]